MRLQHRVSPSDSRAARVAAAQTVWTAARKQLVERRGWLCSKTTALPTSFFIFIYVIWFFFSLFTQCSSWSVVMPDLQLLSKTWPVAHKSLRRLLSFAHSERRSWWMWKTFSRPTGFYFSFSWIATVGLVENVFNKQYHFQMSSLAQTSIPLFAFGLIPVWILRTAK